MKKLAILPLLLAASAYSQDEEAGHMHGPDGRHIAVAETFGASAGKQILSHHDLRIEGPDGKSILGADVHSVVHKKGDPNAVLHREHNTYEPENEVYGSHMMYKEPGEYTIVENVTLPDKRKITVEFPIWVPAPAAAIGEEEHAHGPNWWLIIGAPLLGIGALYGAYKMGRKSAAMATSLLVALGSVPIVRAQESEEAGHMHGPDGRHIGVAEKLGGGGAVPLKAFPSADLGESATKTIDGIKFVLSIENEEMESDPSVVQLDKETAEKIGLRAAAAETISGSGGLVTTGQVRPNANGLVTVNAPASGRIVRLEVTPGQTIGVSQVVAVIDSPEAQETQADLIRAQGETAAARAELTKAQSDVQAAQTRLQAAESTLKRQQDLARAGAFANPALEAARGDLAKAEGDFKDARSELANLEATAKRLREGARLGVVARNEAERAESAVERGRTRVETADRALDIARQALRREEEISQKNLRNLREVQTAESEVRLERSGVQTARSGLAVAKASLIRAQGAAASATLRLKQLGASAGGGSQIAVRSVIGGEIESRPVTLNQTVQEGDLLCRVLNAQTVWIEGDVFERDLAKVRVGQPVKVTADALPGKTFPGVVEYIAGEVNPESRAVKVRTVVRQQGHLLKPNMFARVVLSDGGSSMVAVPAEAVQEDGAASVVFVVAEEGSYRRTEVGVAGTLGERVLISSGLNPGDKVVTQGAYQLLAKAKGG